ncbi:hypothetical protein AL066_10365 [Pseudomonas nunensis]|nr:hypothetical protein AL066_10365 [Pseudomonas nunensis]
MLNSCRTSMNSGLLIMSSSTLRSFSCAISKEDPIRRGTSRSSIVTFAGYSFSSAVIFAMMAVFSSAFFNSAEKLSMVMFNP